MMRYRTLGRSGLQVSEIGLGALTFGRETSAWDARQILDEYVHRGGNLIDTVNHPGAAEEIIGQWMRDGGHRPHVILATKTYLPEDGDPNHRGLSRHAIHYSVEQSLRRLQTDTIDLYMLHHPDPHTPLEESLYALERLTQAGKVRYVACANVAAWEAMHALGIQQARDWAPLTAVQAHYSLLERSSERELQPMLHTLGVPMIAWGALGGGFLTGKYAPDTAPDEDTRLGEPDSPWAAFYARRAYTPRGWAILQSVQAIAAAQGIPPASVALQWVLRQPHVASVLVGARHIGQLDSHLEMVPATLEAADLDALGAASATTEPDYLDDLPNLMAAWARESLRR